MTCMTNVSILDAGTIDAFLLVADVGPWYMNAQICLLGEERATSQAAAMLISNQQTNLTTL